MIRYLKELLLVLYLLKKNYDDYLDRLTALGIGYPVLLYGAMFVVLTVALFMTAYIRQALIRHLFALAMFGSAVFFDVYTQVTAGYMTYSSFCVAGVFRWVHSRSGVPVPRCNRQRDSQWFVAAVRYRAETASTGAVTGCTVGGGASARGADAQRSTVRAGR